jgi:hypothetical protein
VAKPASVLSDYIDEFELAEQLHHDVRTLRNWRKRGTGPGHVMVGRRAYYRREAVHSWLLEREASAA